MPPESDSSKANPRHTIAVRLEALLGGGPPVLELAGWVVLVLCELNEGASRRREMGLRPDEDEPAVDRWLGQGDDLQHGRGSDDRLR